MHTSLSYLKIIFWLSLLVSSNAFLAPSATRTGALSTNVAPSTRLYFFGGPKDDGSPGDYVCLDCGYVFTKGPKAWAELPANWSCPPCGSIKRRFKKVPKGSANSKPEKKKGPFGF